MLKDPYILEFLGLDENKAYLKRELEQGLIDNLQNFFLELGKGFSFVARQKRITIEGDHYYVDLVFYNYILKCFVVIELKTHKLTYQDVGQLDFYVKYFEEKNKLRLTTLSDGKVFMSSLDGFNDPFEGKAFMFDEEELKAKGWDKRLFESFVHQINTNVGIGCFCNADEKEQNMPMWAYYANNHAGFCVEYLVDNKVKKFMYPVSYDDTRVSGNAVIGNIINQTMDLIKQGKNEDDMSGELKALNHMAYLSLTSKHKSWQYEKEIRALVPISYGRYLDMVPNKIFIGINCKDENKQSLIEIAKKFSPTCEVFQMKSAGNSLMHYLLEEKIPI